MMDKEQKEANQGFEEMMKQMGVAITKHIMDESFTICWGNDAFYQMTGFTSHSYLERFTSLKAYGDAYLYDFKPMMCFFCNAYRKQEQNASYVIQLPIHPKGAMWVKVVASFLEQENEVPFVYIVYTDINEIILRQGELYQNERNRLQNLEWILSESVANVYISDMDTYELLYLNKKLCDTLQTSKDQLLGKKCYEVIQGRTSPCPFCTNEQLLYNETYEWEFYNPYLKRTFMIKDRMIYWKEHRARLELSYDMYHKTYQKTKKDQERDVILKTIPAGMVRIHAHDHRCVIWYNEIFLSMLGYTKEQFENEVHNRCNYMHPDDYKRASEVAKKMKKTGENAVLEVRAYTRSKEERIWTVTLCYVSEEDSWDGIPSLYSIGLDITAERKKMENLRHIAEKDALTGIYNRSEVERQIKEYIEEHKDAVAALFMIDTDDFKRINDTKGHMIGDMVLAEMATGMKKIMRDTDVVGRIGGDEFTVFMKDIQSLDDVKKKATDLINMFRHLFETEKSPVSVTCSIGIAIYPEDGSSFKDLYVKADQALYQAKSQGKNSYIIYDSDVFQEAKNIKYISYRTTIESEKRYDSCCDNLTRYVFRTLYEAKDIDKAMNSVLEIVGRQYDVSRAYVFENSEDGLYTSNTYEWCNEGVTPEIHHLQNCDYRAYGDYEKLFGDDDIFYCRDIHTLKPEQEELLSQQGIHSTLQCAFWDNSKFSGFVGFDECSGLRLWTQEEVTTLSLISQILSTFLQRKKMKRANIELEQYQTILNHLGECICVLSKDEQQVLYLNQPFQECCPECKIGDRYHIDDHHFHKLPIQWDGKYAYLYVERLPEIL